MNLIRFFPIALDVAALAGMGWAGSARAQPISLSPSAVPTPVASQPLASPSLATGRPAASLPLASLPGTLSAAPSPVALDQRDRDALPYLRAARTSLGDGQNTEASEALEKAETRLLGRPSSGASERALLDVGVARRALARQDQSATERAIEDAIAAIERPPVVPAPSPVQAQAAPPNAAPPALPPVTYALMPGHWKLEGSQYVWVPPDKKLRRVEDRPKIPGQYVWQNGRWRWIASHYEAN